MATLKVYTVQMAKWRSVQKMGIQFLDITIKSGEAIFAPDWDFLMVYKNSAKGPEDEAEYMRHYAAKINRKLREFPDKFLDIFHLGEVAFACYCPADCFCHRHPFKRAIINLGKQINVEVIDMGEIK